MGRPKREIKLSKKEVVALLEEHGGVVARVCAALQVDRASWFYDALRKKYPDIVDIAWDIKKKSILTDASTALLDNVRAGKETSVIFALKTLGARIGFMEPTQTDSSNNAANGLTVNYNPTFVSVQNDNHT